MKKVIALFLFLVLASSLVFAQGNQGKNNGGQGQLGSPGLIQNASEGERGLGEQVMQQENFSEQIQTRAQERAQSAGELRQMIQSRQQIMNQEMASLGKGQQNVLRNQNRVRVAVHALLAMENLTGGIGRNISQIAREFNNSVQATIRAEEKIQTRSGFIRFFAGGDNKAAEDIEQEVNRNQERIRNMQQMIENCDCDEEVGNMLQEQIQNMEQEQDRMQELARKEKRSKGLFGWLWK